MPIPARLSHKEASVIENCDSAEAPFCLSLWAYGQNRDIAGCNITGRMPLSKVLFGFTIEIAQSAVPETTAS